MYKLFLAAMLVCVITGCSGGLKAGYCIEAEWQTNKTVEI